MCLLPGLEQIINAKRFTRQAGDSPYGIADMISTVGQWCLDWYDRGEYEKHKGIVAQNPQGPPAGAGHVIRGGWSWDDFLVEVYWRSNESEPHSTTGIRVVMTV
jgi:formylglycine-generating enzyme required for sulfatase activity